MQCAEILIPALVFYLNIREPLIVAKPFNDQTTDYVLKCLANETINLGLQKFECWTDGTSVCGQVPMFDKNKLLCRKCCKNVAAENDKIKIKVGEPGENSAKKGKEADKKGKMRKDGLVPEGWKYSSIILIVFVTICIPAFTGVILKMKINAKNGLPRNNHVPQQESHPPSTEDQTGNNETDRLNQNRSNGIQLEQLVMPSS